LSIELDIIATGESSAIMVRHPDLRAATGDLKPIPNDHLILTTSYIQSPYPLNGGTPFKVKSGLKIR